MIHQEDRQNRRAFISMSALSATVSASARRRLNGKPLDEKEQRALVKMIDALTVTAEKTSGETLLSTVSSEKRFAFHYLLNSSPEHQQPDNHTSEHQTLTRIVSQLETISEWYTENMTVAHEIASTFEGLSRVLLSEVAHHGETIRMHTK